MQPEKYKKIEFQWGLVLLRTKRFQSIMDRLGSSRISKPTGWLLLYAMPAAAASGFYLFLSELGILLSPRGQEVASFVRTLGPLANIGIPGINPYLPLVYGWVALVVAMVVHEGAHGVIARSLGLPVKSSGLLFFLFVPVGAFVEVDEGAMKAAPHSHSGRVLGAGAGINVLVALLCLILLFGVTSTMHPKVDGVAIVGVTQGYPAQKAGMTAGEFILAVDGVHYSEPSQLSSASWYKIGENVTMTIWHGGAISNYSLTVASLELNNTQTGQISVVPYIGVQIIGYSGLQQTASTYAGSFFTRPALYLCIPTIPNCESVVPFSGSLAPYYSSALGAGLVPVASLLYWLFFIDFNLAIFNALPIYPLDGGQAFLVGVRALGRGKWSETTLMRITTLATVVVVAVLFGVIAGPYFF
ncbi:MAG: site-2 protease family protein [Nitrososphaerota archaeon]|nr:site-2 protease family protein [Nitrososphaerota archaeon]